MRTSTRWWLGAGLAFAAGIALTIGYQKAYASDGFVKNSVDSFIHPPWSATKILAIVAAALMAPAFALGLAEWRAERAFRRAERELRAVRPLAEVVEYEGPEGNGLLFAGADGRALLLRPTAGLADPRVVELTRPAPEEPPPLADAQGVP